MNYDMLFPILIAFFVTLILSPVMIRFLQRLTFGQFVRGDSLKSHIQKTGTPTMGGLIFLVGITITVCFFLKDNTEIAVILFVTLGFGFIGFIDDYIKVILRRSMGLLLWQKMLGQILVTAAFAYYMVNLYEGGLGMKIPFLRGEELEVGSLYVPILFFIVLGTVNGANFTDGLDGLASSVTLLIAAFFTIVSIMLGVNITPISCAVVGALLGFLVFNIYPAKVFMGDTGSLALGGFVVATAYILKIPLFLPIIALVYFVEVLSVIIQASYFKKTGKRVFKMAPIHHHFELSGWTETKIVAIFCIITTLLCLIAFWAL